jgi:hypothetical protein
MSPKNDRKMIESLRNSLCVLLLVILPGVSYAQKDVTQFLGIPIDGYKPDMLKKLKSKGFSINPHNGDVLDGEFNGTDINIFIATNNNKVWRIAVADTNTMSEGDIKIRFNNLCRQFQNNKNYLFVPDSIRRNTIPEDEDISYELTVKNKRYQAAYYQKPANYDSLVLEQDNLINKKKPLSEEDGKRLGDLFVKVLQAEFTENKLVWFTILQRSGGYYITIFYENVYNKANGEDL